MATPFGVKLPSPIGMGEGVGGEGSPCQVMFKQDGPSRMPVALIGTHYGDGFI
jgi:hypothetical protein